MKSITGLNKPSILSTSNLFSQVNIVIADQDHDMALLIRKLLMTLGCNRVIIMHDGLEVIDLMREVQVDMVDYRMGDENHGQGSI